MNGINYSSLLSNTGLFSNQAANKDEVGIKGSLTSVNKRTGSRTAEDKRQTNADKDTYEYSGQARDVKAGYDRPKRVEAAKEDEYKALDADGIQEGIRLSDAARDLLAELREKYGNMDIAVAEWSTDEEQDYYAGKATKEYSVLINPELLEKMAADESVRAEYEAVLSGAGEKFDTLKEELGEDADKIKSFSITIDKDGKISYAVQLLKDMAESSKEEKKENTASRTQQERMEERRAERKKAEKERLEKLELEKQETEKIEADSIEELIAAIKEKLHPEQMSVTDAVEAAETAAEGQTAAE